MLQSYVWHNHTNEPRQRQGVKFDCLISPRKTNVLESAFRGMSI